MSNEDLTNLIGQLRHWGNIWDGENFDLDNFDPEIFLEAAKALEELIQQVRDKDSALSWQLTDHG